jgi:hypothetical protein
MRASLKLALPVLASVGSAAAAPQVDMAEVMKWSNAKVVRYHVEGVYEAWTPIADEASQSNVTDGLVMDVIWEMRARKAQGMPQIQNKASTSKGLRNIHPPCPAPVMKGQYEHFEAKEVGFDGQDRMALKGIRSFPPIDAGLDCPASNALKASPAKQTEVTEYIALPNPMMLSVGSFNTPNMTVTPDKKSFILKTGNWTWTYTPSLVQ